MRARAESEALRSQLNPHFILNTFHALIGLVRREPAVAEAALERLGDLLRYSLRIQRESLDEVTLRDGRQPNPWIAPLVAGIEARAGEVR